MSRCGQNLQVIKIINEIKMSTDCATIFNNELSHSLISFNHQGFIYEIHLDIVGKDKGDVLAFYPHLHFCEITLKSTRSGKEI